MSRATRNAARADKRAISNFLKNEAEIDRRAAIREKNERKEAVKATEEKRAAQRAKRERLERENAW
jgi:hypothetical protein